MYEHNALGFWSGLALCLTKVRSSRARCPATALITIYGHGGHLGHVTWISQSNFRLPYSWMLHIKFQFDWPCSFREEDL